MRLPPALAALLTACVLPAGIPEAAQMPPEIICSYRDAPATTQRRSLPGNHVIELQRSADKRAVEEACTATIRDASGKTVWSAQGYGALLNAWTGHDVDGDGLPDAVIAVDSGGGNRCCWTYSLVNLLPVFRVVGDLPVAPFFGLDAQKRTVIYEAVAFYDLGPSMADSATITRVHQFSSGRLRDVTRAHCRRILDGTAGAFPTWRPDWEQATPARRAESRTAATPTAELQETRSMVASLALQNLACGQPDEAARLVRETWPPDRAAAQLDTLLKAWAERK
jgi:hypothetical protein